MAERSRDDESADTMRERSTGNTAALWLVMDADRRLVTALLSVALFVGLVAVGSFHPTPVERLLTRGDPLETLYQSLVTATITGVTLVLTLGQLVLSQELGAVGDQRDRMEGAMAFRDDVADAVDTDVSPAEPSAFLRSLVRATGEQAAAFEAASAGGSGEFERVRTAFIDSVRDNAGQVTAQLEGANFGEFDVIKAALNYNYSWKLYAGRRLQTEFAEQLSTEAHDRLSELVETLELFGPAREHFKTLYFQWELSNLSRTLLYVAIPALGVAIASLLFFDAQDFTGATVGVNNALLIVAATTTVSLVPFTVLLAYILRIVTVTKRTLSIGPFILRETDRVEDDDRN